MRSAAVIIRGVTEGYAEHMCVHIRLHCACRVSHVGKTGISHLVSFPSYMRMAC